MAKVRIILDLPTYVWVKTKQIVTFLHSGRDMSLFLLSRHDVASVTFSGILAVLATIGEMTARAVTLK
jgi:hypothetical protein